MKNDSKVFHALERRLAQLEGRIEELVTAHAELQKRLGEQELGSKPELTFASMEIEEVQKVVAKIFRLRNHYVLSQKGRGVESICWPRMVGMFVSRELNLGGYREIAEAFGKKNHHTAIHAYQRVRDLPKSDPFYTPSRECLEEARKILRPEDIKN